MNDILSLKGKFEHRQNIRRGGSPELKDSDVITSGHVLKLAEQLRSIRKYWVGDTLIKGALVSVHYSRVVPKSKRISRLLSARGESPSFSVRGARFERYVNEAGEDKVRHVFTHYVPIDVISDAIGLLENASYVIDEYGGSIDGETVKRLSKMPVFPYDDRIRKTVFAKVLLDVSNIDFFALDDISDSITNSSIISLYRTDMKTEDLLRALGISTASHKLIDENTIRLRADEYALLKEKAPYLIAMSLPDLAEVTPEEPSDNDPYYVKEQAEFDKPGNEPVIGVIDTLFDDRVRFAEWVEFHNMLDPEIPIFPKDKEHGTEVDSILVDGPELNPWLDDGCGRFRVRHFGVATHDRFSAYNVVRNIRQIVRENLDIKVWNLSLGSAEEIRESSISPVAAELDRLQYEYDVIFIVAGTNDNECRGEFRIGSPADSLNSIVVNAVDNDGNTASYTRKGPVLGFFNKPDVCFYGGDGVSYFDRIAVSNGPGFTRYVQGTSFAAPWVARKVAYLICKLGINREVAKALILDSAMGWQNDFPEIYSRGYGIVPKHIDQIIHTEDDEIRFFISGIAENYETYNFNLPIPIVNNEHPFNARATMVYFPECIREQGVDYTCTELDMKFGRVIRRDEKVDFNQVKKIKLSEDANLFLKEAEAREEYRKWDNVKHVVDKLSERRTHTKVYDYGLWGFSIIAMERLAKHHEKPLPFGIVVTLKEKDKVNRIADFMKMCMARGWIVDRVDIRNRLEVYEAAEETIEWT